MRKGRDGGEKREKKEKTDENSGHYVIASSRPPERRPLERRTLLAIATFSECGGWWVMVIIRIKANHGLTELANWN